MKKLIITILLFIEMFALSQTTNPKIEKRIDSNGKLFAIFETYFDELGRMIKKLEYFEQETPP